MKKEVTAYANANIALVKYWGKNDMPGNIPAVSSLSMTLNDRGTLVSVSNTSSSHELFIDSKPAEAPAYTRLCEYLEEVRSIYHFSGFLRIKGESSLPYASGLASSSAFFAALALALDDLLDLKLDKTRLSILARMGSGSAARSIFSGFSALYGGLSLNHDEAYAFPVEVHPNFKLIMVIATINDEPKALSSRHAMNITKKTSPFFNTFVETSDEDFIKAITALKESSFTTLGEIMEHSTLKMFGTMWSAKPPIIYWHEKTLALLNIVYQMRKQHGPIAFFTMDAGAHVKILCEEKDLALVVKTIAASKLALNIYCAAPGDGAKIVSSSKL